MVDWVTGVPSEAAVWVARTVLGVTFLISGVVGNCFCEYNLGYVCSGTPC
jgi:hypothetical protein